MKTKNISFLTFLFLFFSTISHARHLIGGEMTYQCLGNGDYEIDLSLYRDCASSGAPFDDLAAIAIYKCGGDVNCSNLSQSDALSSFDVSLGPVFPVQINLNNPCLIIPPGVCIELGKYKFKLSDFGINLLADDNSYHIVYQRCCRNSTTANIVNPQEFGNSFSVEITPKAQEYCNNSPKFIDVLPFVTCRGMDTNYKHSAIDIDGDSLVYNFSPLMGGGGNIISGMEVNSCNGVIPNPSCPPPFNSVPFVGGFSYDAPFGESEKTISIDSETGVISGILPFMGQFSYSIAVSEFRNGEFLGVTRIEAQTNITNCGVISADSTDCFFTSIVDIDSDVNFAINPNPVNDYFIVNSSLQNENSYTIKIYNFQGNLISEHLGTNSSEIILTDKLERGMYLVLIRLEETSYFKKMIKL